MKLLLSLALALFVAPAFATSTRTIKLGDMQPNQRIEVDWKYQGCFTSGHYTMTFSYAPKLQIEFKQISSLSNAEIQQSTLPVTKKSLTEWDAALADYRVADPSRSPTCTSTEEVVVTLYEDGVERYREALENKSCSETKIWVFVDALKKRANFTLFN